MNPGSNKSEKMHLRLTEDMAREVRATADLDHRHIQDQFRFLIYLGLQVRRSGVQGNGVESRRTVTPDDAQLILPASPIAASRRTVTRGKERSA